MIYDCPTSRGVGRTRHTEETLEQTEEITTFQQRGWQGTGLSAIVTADAFESQVKTIGDPWMEPTSAVDR